MREKTEGILKSIFSIAGMISIAGGFIVFILLLFSIVIGGETGGNLAVKANKEFMPYFIKAATVAAMAGLINFYIKKDHALSIQNESKKSHNEAETGEVY